jgi:hypothetical protein
MLHGNPRPLAPTSKGRRTLRALREQPAGADAESMGVALGGRAAMADAKLRTAVFEPPDTTQVIPRGRRWAPRDYSDDPQVAAYRTDAEIGRGFGIGGVIDGGGGS